MNQTTTPRASSDRLEARSVDNRPDLLRCWTRSYYWYREGATMKDKRTYEKPELQRLGLLRDLTKSTQSFTPPRWGWPN